MKKTFVGMILVGVLLGACIDPKAEEARRVEKTCAKIESFAKSPSPQQRDMCLAQYSALGPNVRACFDPCIDRAKDAIDYELCKDECTSRSGFAGTLCWNEYTFEQAQQDTCTSALAPLAASDPAKLRCIGRCRRTTESSTLLACSKQCGGPELPAHQ